VGNLHIPDEERVFPPVPVGGHRVCFAIISQAHSRFLVCSNLLAPFRYRIYLTQRKNNAVAVFILLQSVRQLKN